MHGRRDGYRVSGSDAIPAVLLNREDARPRHLRTPRLTPGEQREVQLRRQSTLVRQL